MTNLFNINKIHNTNSIIKNIVVESNRETYLFTSLNILKEMNTSIEESTKKLYCKICEAENKTDENQYFCEYFLVFKESIYDAINKLNQLTQRFIISFENIIDSNEDLLKVDLVNNFTDGKIFSMNLYTYNTKRLIYKKYPVFNPTKIFKKDFDSIGLLLQDKSIHASDKDKLNIIATVYNNLVKEIDNKWYKETIKDILGDHDEDDCDDHSFAKCIYNSFVEKAGEKIETNITKSHIYDAKQALESYDTICNNIKEMSDDLIYQLESIANEVGDMIYRNSDGKLKIRSNNEEVKDRDYQLDTYSMNQFDIFLKAKTNQIKQICNLYIIAYSIKLDTIIDYINQNKDILNSVKEILYPKIYKNSNDIVDNTDNDIDSIDDLDDDQYDSDSSKENEENNKDLEENEDYDINNDKDNPEEFKESYLFESELFFIDQYDNDQNLFEFIKEQIFMEDGTSPVQNVKDLADKNSNKIMELIRTIINKLAGLWNRFKDTFINKYQKRIDYLKENKKYIDQKCPDFEGDITVLVPDLNKFNNLDIKDLNYDAMKKDLASETDFIKKYYNEFVPDDKQSFSDAIKNSILSEDKKEKITSPSQFDSKKDQWFKYCMEYDKTVDEIKKMTDIIQKGRDSASKIAKSFGESTSKEYYEKLYFAEMENNTKETKTSDGEEKKVNDKDNVKVYFKVTSQVLAAKMTLAQKIFNEFYSALDWIIKRNGGGNKEQDTNNNTNKEQNNNQSEKDVKFN